MQSVRDASHLHTSFAHGARRACRRASPRQPGSAAVRVGQVGPSGRMRPSMSGTWVGGPVPPEEAAEGRHRSRRAIDRTLLGRSDSSVVPMNAVQWLGHAIPSRAHPARSFAPREATRRVAIPWAPLPGTPASELLFDILSTPSRDETPRRWRGDVPPWEEAWCTRHRRSLCGRDPRVSLSAAS